MSNSLPIIDEIQNVVLDSFKAVLLLTVILWNLLQTVLTACFYQLVEVLSIAVCGLMIRLTIYLLGGPTKVILHFCL